MSRSKYTDHIYKHTKKQKRRQLFTIVELAVALLTVNYIKTVGDVSLHVADFKVEPLCMLGTVNICIQYEVILISKGREVKRNMKHWCGFIVAILVGLFGYLTINVLYLG